jgi:hypothetical protein
MPRPLTEAQIRQQLLQFADRLLPGEGPVSALLARGSISAAGASLHKGNSAC